MNFQPAPLNGKLQAGAVLSGRALVVEQEGAVEFLDVDPALLNWLEACACSSKRRAAFSGSANGRSTVSFKTKISRFPMPGEWRGAAVLSCQFGTMCTEPAAPHCLQTSRRPIVDQGKSWGRVSNRTSTMRRSHLSPEHLMLQVMWPSASHSAGPPGGYLSFDRARRCGAIADDPAAVLCKISIPRGLEQRQATACRAWQRLRRGNRNRFLNKPDGAG